MNEICPHCGECQRFPVELMDSVVSCCYCGGEFLLAAGPRDIPPQRSLKPIFQCLVVAAFWLLVVGCAGACYLVPILGIFGR
jgi:hypothetical protein